MGEILQLTDQDIPAVAELFLKVFRKSTSKAPSSLVKYFSSIYLENPWYDPAYGSLVCKDREGRTTGFIGAVPRPMVFGTRRITAVVAGNHMVDPELGDPFTAGLLLRKLLSGKQDVTFSDSANEASRRMWEGTDACTMYLYSLRWLRVLRPLMYGISLLRRQQGSRAVAAVANPFARLADAAVAPHTLNRGLAKPSEELRTHELSLEEFYANVTAWTSPFELRPANERSDLEWLLLRASEKTQYGPLFKFAVESSHSVIGHFLFYLRPGGTAEVLQILSRPNHFDVVLRSLFRAVLTLGGIAVIGSSAPSNFMSLSTNRCLLFHRNQSMVVHAKDRTILDAFHRGTAFAGRLESEWWTRLQGDRFE